MDIWLPDQIYGPPPGWRSAISKVAMLRATMEGHRGSRALRVWKAISRGLCQNLAEASRREAQAVMPRAPSSLRICVQERIAAPQ